MSARVKVSKKQTKDDPGARAEEMPVLERSLDIEWIFAGKKTFFDYACMLYRENAITRIFDTDGMKVLMHEFWDEMSEKQLREIVRYAFIPWLVQVCGSVVYFATVLADDVKEKSLGQVFLGVIVILDGMYLFYIELKQITLHGIKNHFASAVNYFDIPISIVPIILVILNLATDNEVGGTYNESLPIQRLIAVGTILLMALKFFDWMRLFSSTSFFVTLIHETFWDIRNFSLIFLIMLAFFGCVMNMLQMNTKYDADPIVSDNTGFFLTNSLLNVYLLGLGEFEMDGFKDHPQFYFCYILFIIATFNTQIVFLNMLITIMGDTFERVMDNRVLVANLNKFQFLVDFNRVFSSDNFQVSAVVLFVVTPIREEGEVQSTGWEGSLNQQKKQIMKVFDKITVLESQIKAQNEEMKAQNAVMRAEMKAQNYEMKVQNAQIQTVMLTLLEEIKMNAPPNVAAPEE